MPVPCSSIPSASSVPPLPADGLDPQITARVRELVVAGPAGGKTDLLAGMGLLGRIVSAEAITAALEAAGHTDQRRRGLPGEVTMAAVVNLALYSGEGYDTVLARTAAQLPAMVAPGRTVPSGSALSQARVRLTAEPMRQLFTATADRDTGEFPQVNGGRVFGLEVTAFDGTTLDLSSQGTVADEFAIPSGGRHPKARVVTLTRCASRKIAAAAVGSSGVGEQPLCDELAGALGPGMLNLADRNFFSMARWVRFSGTGAHLIWRVKNGAKSVPAKIVRRLGDGSCLVRLTESAGMLSQRRTAAGDKSLALLPDTLARLVEFDLITRDASGRMRTSRLRLLTTLLDHIACPAEQIAAAYAERWQAEMCQPQCTHRYVLAA